jgi:hypothetical protein
MMGFMLTPVYDQGAWDPGTRGLRVFVPASTSAEAALRIGRSELVVGPRDFNRLSGKQFECWVELVVGRPTLFIEQRSAKICTSVRAAAGAGGGGGGAADGGAALPSIDGLEICCIGAGYVGGPTMAVIAKRAWADPLPLFSPLPLPHPVNNKPPPSPPRSAACTLT